jgi:hypothetical protein
MRLALQLLLAALQVLAVVLQALVLCAGLQALWP